MIETGIWHGCYVVGGADRRLWMRPRRDADNYRAHPARMSWALAVRIYAEGHRRGWWGHDSIMCSPMCGEGTEMLVFYLNGHDVYGIDVEASFCDTAIYYLTNMSAKMSADMFTRKGAFHIYLSDATKQWPDHIPPVQAIVFSPTYDSAISYGGEGAYAPSLKKEERGRRKRVGKGMPFYGNSAGQIGFLRKEQWRAAMKEVYMRCCEHAAPGCHMVTVTKNVRWNYELVRLDNITAADATESGWTLIGHYVADGAARSVMARYNNERFARMGRADLIVDHEDILVFKNSSSQDAHLTK